MEERKHFKPGEPVVVHKDDGMDFPTTTRSESWMYAGSEVVLVEGIAGWYWTDRVERITASSE